MCCKHFAVYDSEGGTGLVNDRYTFNANVTGRDMWETYMPAFKACVAEAGGTHDMCSYNQLNGVPTCANEGLLTTVLRDQWNFTGFVVGDYDAWYFMSDEADDYHSAHYVKTSEDAAAAGINAGIDQEGGGNGVTSHLQDAIKHGKTTKAKVEEAFRRVFRIRIRMGMLDPPIGDNVKTYNSLYYDQTELGINNKHLAVALKAAQDSMTLLKNDAMTTIGATTSATMVTKPALPLDPAAFKTKPMSLAVIGPQANVSGMLFGDYAEMPAFGTFGNVNSTTGKNWGQSIVQALESRLGGPSSIAHVAGCDGDTPIACITQDSLPDAVKASQSADAIVVTLGLAFDKFCEPTGGGAIPGTRGDFCEREGQDRKDIEMTEGQKDLVKALRAANMNPRKPIIAVLLHGGTIAFGDDVLNDLDAVLDAWYPGIGGGPAIAGALFGDYSPAGRSAVTWYKNTSQLPPMGRMSLYPAKATDAADTAAGQQLQPRQQQPPMPHANGITYRYFTGDVEFPFGHGLSYSSFRYSNLTVAAASVTACKNIEVSFTVTNVGDMDAEEVMQLYVKQPYASVPVPNIRLAAFDRKLIKQKESTTVTMVIKPKHHTAILEDAGGDAIFTASSSEVIESGSIELHVGGGQPGYFEGSLSTTVAVTTTSKLLACEE
jgi:beta-glucosidase